MRYCLFLLAAGLLDAIMTQVGMEKGAIQEGNPLMGLAIEKSWIFFYLIKIFLPAALTFLYYLKPLKGKIKFMLQTACGLYLSVLVVHIVWIYLYLNDSA